MYFSYIKGGINAMDFNEENNGRINEFFVNELSLHTTLYELYKERYMYENMNPEHRLKLISEYRCLMACDKIDYSFDRFLSEHEDEHYLGFYEFLETYFGDFDYITELIESIPASDEITEDAKKMMMTSYLYYYEAEKDKDKEME